MQQQNYPAAESGFRGVLKLEPRNIGALGNLGVVYSRTHRYTQAIDTYKTALKLAPGDPAVLTNLGLAYVKQEQYGPAAAVFEKLATDPTNPQAGELLASCRISLGQYQQALQSIGPLLAAGPGNAGLYYMQGIAFARLKQPDEARAAFAKMMQAAEPAQASFLMGKASYETGDFEQAASFFRAALQNADTAADAHRELGKTLISLRRDEEAEQELRLSNPDDAEAAYFLGALLWRTKPAEAASLLRRAHGLTPDFWGPLYYLGRLNVQEGRLKEGIPQLEQAARLKPGLAAIPYQLAAAYKRAGRDAEAKAALARVKELNGNALREEVGILTPREGESDLSPAPDTRKPK